MKKRIICIMMTALLLAGCICSASADETLTIQDIMAANTLVAVLKRHANAAEYLANEDGSRVLYVDENVRYEHYLPANAASGSGYELMLGDNGAVMYNEQYDMFYFVANVGLGYERKYSPTDEHFGNLAYDPEATALETVVEVRDEGDTLVAVTETPAALLNELDYGLPEDGVYVVEYTLEKDTLEIQGTVEYVRRASGAREQESNQALMYDIKLTEDISSMMDARDVILHDKSQRTLTFIKDPGTAGETETKVTLATGVYITYWADEKGYEAYADPEGKTPWEDDYMNDQIIYLINPMNSSVAL